MNQKDTKGAIPSKVPCPMPGTDKTQPAYKRQGSAPKAPAGFDSALKPGKI